MSLVLLAPIYLLLLPLWIAAVVFACVGRSPAVRVSTVRFWKNLPTEERQRQRWRRPPLWVLLLLLTALFVLLSLAGPVWRGDRVAPVTLIVDRGLLTLTALQKDPDKTLDLLFGRVEPSANQDRPSGSRRSDALITLQTVPGRTEKVRLSQLRNRLQELRATAVDTTPMLLEALRKRTSRDGQNIQLDQNGEGNEAAPADTVFCLTDKSPLLKNDRDAIRIVRPLTPVMNAGIDRFVVSTFRPGGLAGDDGADVGPERPTCEAMVRIYNGTALRSAVLRIGQVEQSITLPPTGQRDNYFVRLPALDATTLSCEMLLADDIAADNKAYVVRERASGRVRVVGRVPPEVRRVVDLYERFRPRQTDQHADLMKSADATDDGNVVVTVDPTVPQRGVAALVISSGNVGSVSLEDLPARRPAATSASAIVNEGYDKLTSGIDWDRVAADAGVSAEADGGKTDFLKRDGWKSLVTVGSVTLVWVRDLPARSALINFATSRWAGEADFVIFVARVLDWLAGDRGLTSTDVSQLPATFTGLELADSGVDSSPGLYSPDGDRRGQIAANMRAVDPVSDGAMESGSLPTETNINGDRGNRNGSADDRSLALRAVDREIAEFLKYIALTLLAVALVVRERPGRTKFRR